MKLTQLIIVYMIVDQFYRFTVSVTSHDRNFFKPDDILKICSRGRVYSLTCCLADTLFFLFV